MRTNKLLKYGLLAGVGYLIYKHMQTQVAPAVTVAPPAPAVSGFGRLGYYPSGADRPFQAAAHKAPFARYDAGTRWW